MFTSRNTSKYYLFHIYAPLIIPPIQLYTQIQIHVFYRGGQFDLPCNPQDKCLWDTNLSLGPKKCKEILSLTINLFTLCKNGWFPCQPLTGFLAMEVYIKIGQIFAVTYSKPLNLVSLKRVYIVLSSCGK